MRAALARGYGHRSTDTGHVSSGVRLDLGTRKGPTSSGHFGHRGRTFTAENGKQISRAFYGERPRYSYYVGCSRAGQQGR